MNQHSNTHASATNAHGCCSHDKAEQGPVSATLKDPVCGMTVTPQSKHQFAFQGTTYYFAVQVAARNSALIRSITLNL